MIDEPTFEPRRWHKEEHAYPDDLVSFVRGLWADHPASSDETLASPTPSDTLPEPPVLERILSACYHASLMREEERPVTFRLILRDLKHYAPEDGPPRGLHPMAFAESRPLDADELRRLSPAADYARSLIGAHIDGSGRPRIWGLVHSGPRWLRSTQGGREAAPPLPPSPIVLVEGPGRLEVHKGATSIGVLRGGVLSGPTHSVYESSWLPAHFAAVRAELNELHAEARERARLERGEVWAALDPDVTRSIAQRMVKRLIATVKSLRHGATILIVPPDLGEDVFEEGYVSPKFVFPDDAPRRRFRTLMVEAMNALAREYGGAGEDSGPVGWNEYQSSSSRAISELDEAIFEISHLIAGLTSVDGAVVMTQRFELLGFGCEISAALSEVRSVRRAVDLEGEEVVEEGTEGVGTRHRSAYRLANALPGTLVYVISQDGGVRFVKRKGDGVTYWDQT